MTKRSGRVVSSELAHFSRSGSAQLHTQPRCLRPASTRHPPPHPPAVSPPCARVWTVQDNRAKLGRVCAHERCVAACAPVAPSARTVAQTRRANRRIRVTFLAPVGVAALTPASLHNFGKYVDLFVSAEKECADVGSLLNLVLLSLRKGCRDSDQTRADEHIWRVACMGVQRP